MNAAYKFQVKIKESATYLRNALKPVYNKSQVDAPNEQFGRFSNSPITEIGNNCQKDRQWNVGMGPTIETDCPGQELVSNQVPKPKIQNLKSGNVKKHMCDTCGKTFMFQSNLNDHVRVHSGDKPFICNVCAQRSVHRLFMSLVKL